MSWRSSSPVRASQIRAVRSLLAVAIVAPSGLKATACTGSVWPVSCRNSAPVRVSQIRTVRSTPPVAMVSPSGAKATARTWPAWPLNGLALRSASAIRAPGIAAGIDPVIPQKLHPMTRVRMALIWPGTLVGGLGHRL